jgi:hypothetical protein
MSELPPVPKSTPSPHRQEGGDDGAMPLPPAVKPGAVAVPGIRAETTGDDVSFTPSNQSMQPVEAVAVEDDLKRRNDLESQLEQVLREQENAVVAQVVDVNEESQQIDSKFLRYKNLATCGCCRHRCGNSADCSRGAGDSSEI